MATAAAQRTGEPRSDEELLDRIESGDEAAFDLLYDRYFPRVFQFVHKRVRNRADAEETAQEVFIGVFSSLASYRREGPFAAWVLGVARRTVANRFKKKQHATVPLDTTEETESVDLLLPSAQRAATPHEFYECRERISRMEAAAARHLSGDQWRLFELHHLNDRSIQDLATATNKSQDAIKSHLYRVRKVLLAR